MITAADALGLRGAQLSADECESVRVLLGAIEAHIQTSMSWHGIDFQTNESRKNVVAEVNQQLKRANWQPTWQAMVSRSPLDPNRTQIVGYLLSLAPSDEAYREAERMPQGVIDIPAGSGN